jgi:hypothetical protein
MYLVSLDLFQVYSSVVFTLFTLLSNRCLELFHLGKLKFYIHVLWFGFGLSPKIHMLEASPSVVCLSGGTYERWGLLESN